MKGQIISAIILATILLTGTGLFFWQADFFSTNAIKKIVRENDQLKMENEYLEGLNEDYIHSNKRCENILNELIDLAIEDDCNRKDEVCSLELKLFNLIK